MFRDPLQQRLYEMEKENPSVNTHDVPFFRSLSDRVHFIFRYISSSVTEYTNELRKTEDWEKYKAGRDYFSLCRLAALNHPSPAYYEFARTSGIRTIDL